MSLILHLSFETEAAATPAVATITTTPGAIRDRIYAVIEGLTPRSLTSDRFVRYRNELGADFSKWALAHPAACRRRFQVRKSGDVREAEVSNSDIEERRVTFKVLRAYPQTHRDGPDAAMDRDDAIDDDSDQIEYAIGMTGRANFAYPTYPDACWVEQTMPETDDLDGVDIVEMTFSYLYKRARS